MKKFNNISDAINWLESQIRFKPKEDLTLVLKAFEKLNINLKEVKKIHVLGTNGKGSTTAYLTNVLVNNSLKVGTFTSPYLIIFSERIKINNENISESNLLNLINEFYNFNLELEKVEGFKLSFFELLTLMAFKHFSEEEVDVIVIEAGIGGRLDATNILNYDATIITSIGYDHQNVLGNSLKKIAIEKLGALKENGLLVANPPFRLRKKFKNYAISKNSKYLFVNHFDFKIVKGNKFHYDDKYFSLKMLGDYQRYNAILAYLTIKSLFDFRTRNVIPFINETIWEGRLELVAPGIYLDGAHNISAIKALNKTMNKMFLGKKMTVLFSALKDKEVKKMVKVFKGKKVILTSFPDFRFASLERFSTKKIKYQENSLKVLKELIASKKKGEVVIVTGSLHFIGYIKKHLKEVL